MESLAVKYRPKRFEEVCSQKSIIKTLERQLDLHQFVNCYLFSGASGCGKTTIARIFANMINNFQGTPIEIDAASNNGVDSIREIVDNANARSLDSEYKIYIIDECHMLTIQSWNAFLKCIEEPPKYTIFMFCTTDAQKIPATIINRVMRFNLTKVNQEEIKNRLEYVCEQEHFTNYKETIDYISKLCNGGMRDALAFLDKCSGYSSDLCIQNALKVLGNFSYDSMFSLTNAIIDNNENDICTIIEDYYNNGNDLKLFIEQYLDFILDLTKYCIFNSLEILKIPQLYSKDIRYTTGIDNNKKYFSWLCDRVLMIKNSIKNDSNARTTIIVMLLQISRGV